MFLYCPTYILSTCLANSDTRMPLSYLAVSFFLITFSPSFIFSTRKSLDAVMTVENTDVYVYIYVCICLKENTRNREHSTRTGVYCSKSTGEVLLATLFHPEA